MSEITPIIIRLEIEKSAPFFKLEFSTTDDNAESIEEPLRIALSNTAKTMLASKRRSKKATVTTAQQSATTAPSIAPVLGEDCSNGRGALPPIAADPRPQNTERPAPSQSQCFGRRKYAEVVVETFSEEILSNKPTAASASSASSTTVPYRDIAGSEPPQGCSVQPTPSGSSISSSKTASEPSLDVDKMTYFSGNPFVEKTSGILHFYKHSESNLVQKRKCSMLCMMAVPSLITCHELLKFVAPNLPTISAMKIIRDMTPNQYMVIIKFKSHEAAMVFYEECNNARYNEIEPERCSLTFVESIESVHEEASGSIPLEGLTELPTCAVCLERMDDSVLTILCNHTFHAKCLQQWADTTCPVCRHGQTPELTPDQKCFDCGKTTDLWICLICGNIGCGRYADAHAYRHFEATSHTFTLQIGGERVWDYAGDNYVHRLIQSATDGKVVEFERNATAQSDVMGDEKTEAIQLEYTCLLTSQLEQQRIYFENKLSEAERRFGKIEKMAQAQIDDLEVKLKMAAAECENLKTELSNSEHQRQVMEKKQQNMQHKLNKVLNELSEERSINKMLRDDQNKWTEKVNSLEMKNEALHDKFTATVAELNEQVRDLMMHFDAQNKFKETLDQEGFTQKELEEGTVSVGEIQPHSPGKSGKRRSKK